MISIRTGGENVYLSIRNADDIVGKLEGYSDPFRLTYLALTPDTGRLRAEYFPKPLSFPYLRWIAVRFCDARIVDIVDNSTVQQLERINIFNESRGCLVGMDKIEDLRLAEISMICVSVLPSEAAWITDFPNLLGLTLSGVRGISEDFLHRFKSKNVLRKLEILDVFPELCNSMIENLVYPSVRWLDLRNTSLSNIDVKLLVKCFPVVEAFFAEDGELSSDQMEYIRNAYDKLIIFQVGDERFDFFNLPEGQFWEL